MFAQFQRFRAPFDSVMHRLWHSLFPDQQFVIANTYYVVSFQTEKFLALSHPQRRQRVKSLFKPADRSAYQSIAGHDEMHVDFTK